MGALVSCDEPESRQVLKDLREKFDGDVVALRNRTGACIAVRRQKLERQQRVVGLF